MDGHGKKTSDFTFKLNVIQLIQLRLSLQKRKLLTMSVQGMIDICLGPNAQGYTFEASKSYPMGP